MSEQPGGIGDHIESALRMLNAARAEFRRDRGEDAAEFLRCAQRRIGGAINALEVSAKVVPLTREKGNAR